MLQRFEILDSFECDKLLDGAKYAIEDLRRHGYEPEGIYVNPAYYYRLVSEDNTQTIQFAADSHDILLSIYNVPFVLDNSGSVEFAIEADVGADYVWPSSKKRQKAKPVLVRKTRFARILLGI